VTALIGSTLWATVAGLAVALLVAALVAAVVRVQRPSAATRCTLWFVALAICALAPVAIVGAMCVRGAEQPVLAQTPGAYAPIVLPHALRVAAAPSRLHALATVTHAIRRAPSLTTNVAVAIAAVWAVGALAGLLGLVRSIARVQALKARSSPLDGSLVDDLPWLTETAGREIYLRLSYEIETPIAIGFRRPVILIPTDMATLDGLQAIEPLVIHEYAHLTRYDDWTNLAQRCIERLFWFNPLVWIVGRRIALEREVAADDAVVLRTNDAKQYATTLWRMAREMRMPEHVVVAPGAMLTRKQISVRIERLLEDTRVRRPRVGTAIAVVAIAACTVAAVAATAPPAALSAVASAAPAPQLAPVAAETPVATPIPAPPPARTRHAAKATATTTDAAFPTPPPLPALADLQAQIQRRLDAAAQQAQTQLHVAAVTIAATHAHAMPQALPTGELTREIVAACRSCDFSHRDLSNLDLSYLSFDGANFDGADLSNTDFSDARLTGVSMNGSDLANANFSNARITASQLDGANFNGANFTNTRFSATTIDWAAAHGAISLHALADGCTGCNFQSADLHGQNLSGVQLDGANFQGADLHDADLRGARLTGANFQDADLDRADLRDADLTGANLFGSSMNATLTAHATLTGATLP
jgi:uncharacterized protein YjbI with pentapeptide repeats/beta-lactamase regulating signal transducer with metallopeptidase domain